MIRDVWDSETIARYTKDGHWDDQSLGDRLRQLAHERPDAVAFIDEQDKKITWAEYFESAQQFAQVFAANGKDSVAILIHDGWLLHALYMAAEYAGVVVVGIGPRAGDREIAHILRTTGTRFLVTPSRHRSRDTDDLISSLAELEFIVEDHLKVDGAYPSELQVSLNGAQQTLNSAGDLDLRGRRIGPNQLFFINSTSGTTGLPKCVMHTQNRWKYFHNKCIQFQPDDVFLVAVANPFGFGIWMSHTSPLMLGAPTVLMENFSVGSMLDLIERHRVTVLAAVTTQVLMLLNEPGIEHRHLDSLRIIQTGGERVPFARSVELEQITGAYVLQFYGSNESGCLSRTETTQTVEQRLGTAGQVIPEMNVRVFDDDGNDVTNTGQSGRSACKGPSLSPGYFGSHEGNKELFRSDGWMYLGDIVSIDSNGFLRVEGRASDFIIRGGHNISAAMMEEELLSHPKIAEVAVVGVPDETFGERACAVVVTAGDMTIDLSELLAHLAQRAVSKTMWPEHLVTMSELPRSTGGKVAKQTIREILAVSFAEAGDN
jgi:acyl-CoA synthetase